MKRESSLFKHWGIQKLHC